MSYVLLIKVFIAKYCFRSILWVMETELRSFLSANHFTLSTSCFLLCSRADKLAVIVCFGETKIGMLPLRLKKHRFFLTMRAAQNSDLSVDTLINLQLHDLQQVQLKI